MSNPIGMANAVINPMNNTEVIVTLTGVANSRRVTVSLNGVNTTLNTSVSIGFLEGDVDNTRTVDATDVAESKLRAATAVTAANFKFDLNANGVINASDVVITRNRVGGAL
jgi:hypothetical protein